MLEAIVQHSLRATGKRDISTLKGGLRGFGGFPLLPQRFRPGFRAGQLRFLKALCPPGGVDPAFFRHLTTARKESTDATTKKFSASLQAALNNWPRNRLRNPWNIRDHGRFSVKHSGERNGRLLRRHRIQPHGAASFLGRHTARRPSSTNG